MSPPNHEQKKYPGPTDEQLWDAVGPGDDWEEQVDDFVAALEQKTNQALYNEFTDFMRYVFQDADHPNKAKFIDEVITRYKERFRQKAIVFSLNRETLF